MSSRSRHSVATFAAVTALGVASAGCLGEDPFAVDEGDFNATISGGFDGQLRGPAFFNVVPRGEPGDGYFVIRLVDVTGAAGELDIVFYRALPGIPAPNQFPLQPVVAFEPPPAVFAGDVVTGSLTASGGALTLGSTKPTEVRGSFSLTAEGPWPATAQGVSLSVHGDFRAVQASIVFPGLEN